VAVVTDSPAGRRRLAAVLRQGGVAVVPCDTIYGIVGVAPETEGRIRSIKGREEGKPFLQLVADVSWVRRACGVAPPPGLARHWPGPLTVVLPVAGRLPPASLALRVPGSAWLRELIDGLGRPIYSTSVNRAGAEPMWRIADIVRELEGDVDLVVDGGDLPESVPSTIVDATSRPFRLVRRGALAIGPEDLA
jgi:L-threonylcarbamoyladenylate synthase